MKLKLESQDGVAILHVFEDVTGQQPSILRAGLAKLFSVGKKEVVINLTTAGVIDAQAQIEIQDFHRLAQEQDAQLVVASPIVGLGQAPTLEQGVQLIKSPLFIVLSQETRLKTRLRLLEHHREDLRGKLRSADATLVRKVRAEHSELKQLVQKLESQIAILVEDGPNLPPVRSDQQLKAVRDTAHYVLATRKLMGEENTL